MKIKLNLNIFLFLLIFVFTKQIKIYTMLMIFVFIHEISHLIIGILLGFKPKTFKIMPLGFSIEFEIKFENYTKEINSVAIKKILIAIAGPLINLIIALLGIIYNVDIIAIYSNLLIASFNLIPIYPLDGGRILKNILKIFFKNRKANYYINKISNWIMILLTAISSILVVKYKNVGILFTIIFLWYLVILENKRYKLINKIYKTIDNQRNYL